MFYDKIMIVFSPLIFSSPEKSRTIKIRWLLEPVREGIPSTPIFLSVAILATTAPITKTPTRVLRRPAEQNQAQCTTSIPRKKIISSKPLSSQLTSCLVLTTSPQRRDLLGYAGAVSQKPTNLNSTTILVPTTTREGSG